MRLVHRGTWLFHRAARGAVMRSLTICIGILSFVRQPALAYAAMPPPSTIQTLTRLEPEWAAMDAPGHVQFLRTLLAANFVDVSFKVRLRTKQETLASATTSSLDSQTLSDLRVRQFGNTAVVTGLNTVIGKQHAWLARLRFTDVFVRRVGAWRAVSAQETLESSRRP